MFLSTSLNDQRGEGKSPVGECVNDPSCHEASAEICDRSPAGSLPDTKNECLEAGCLSDQPDVRLRGSDRCANSKGL